MKTLGIHSFVWTGGTTQEDLESAMEKSAALGYGLIEFPRLDPSKFDVAWLAKRLEDYKLKVVVTMGLPLDSDISSEDADSVKRGEQVLDDAVKVTRDLGGEKLGGIIFPLIPSISACRQRKAGTTASTSWRVLQSVPRRLVSR